MSALGVTKTRSSGFPGSSQYFYSRKLVWQPIQDTTMTKYRRSRSSLIGALFDALLSDRATNAWAMGTSVDDVFALSTLDGVVWFMDSAIDALTLKMVKIF
jgi:hypothetical protein